jgi:outer membrane protein assembly factor BamB
MWCYDAHTGAFQWKFKTEPTTEVAQGYYGFWGRSILSGDGKLYCATGEHTDPNPRPRGPRMYCWNAYTGELLWDFPLQEGAGGIAANTFWYSDAYTGQLFVWGKGESKTDVWIQNDVIEDGSTALISGRVTDQSPGQPGTPCVSDESMDDWMEYLHNNQPMPMDVTGVPVDLVAIHEGGTVSNIGSVMTDADGYFYHMFEPTTEGVYTIVANFAGSGAYDSSYGEAGLGVTETVAPVPGPAGPQGEPGPAGPEPALTTSLGIAGVISAVIAAIIAFVVVWLLRKR